MIYLFFAIIVLVVSLFIFSKRKYKIKTTTIVDETLPVGFESLSIVLVSNFSRIYEIDTLIPFVKNSIVIVLGDVVQKKQSSKRVKKQLALFKSLLPKYFIFSESENAWGKKDVDALLLENQFTILQNDRVIFYGDDLESKVVIVGIDEGMKGETQYHYAYTDIDECDYVIVCSYDFPKELVNDQRFRFSGLITSKEFVNETTRKIWGYSTKQHKDSFLGYITRQPELHTITITR